MEGQKTADQLQEEAADNQHYVASIELSAGDLTDKEMSLERQPIC